MFDCWSYMCGSVSGWSPQKALKRTSGVSCKWQTSFFRQSLILPRSSHPSCAVCAIVYTRYACSGCLPLSFGVGLCNSSSLEFGARHGASLKAFLRHLISTATLISNTSLNAGAKWYFKGCIGNHEVTEGTQVPWPPSSAPLLCPVAAEPSVLLDPLYVSDGFSCC